VAYDFFGPLCIEQKLQETSVHENESYQALSPCAPTSPTRWIPPPPTTVVSATPRRAHCRAGSQLMMSQLQRTTNYMYVIKSILINYWQNRVIPRKPNTRRA